MDFIWIRCYDWGWVVLHEIDFPWNNFPIDSLVLPHMETSDLNTNMCKFESSQKKKAESSRLIPSKLATNLELLIVLSYR